MVLVCREKFDVVECGALSVIGNAFDADLIAGAQRDTWDGAPRRR